MWTVIAPISIVLALFAWCLCRVSAIADRDAANAWMDYVIEKPADLYPSVVTKAEAEAVATEVWR